MKRCVHIRPMVVGHGDLTDAPLWCSNCGAIWHRTRLKPKEPFTYGAWSKRGRWIKPRKAT